MFLTFDPLRQEPIDAARLAAMLELRPRRVHLLEEWPNALHEPSGNYKNWSLVLPFCETLANAFHSMCDVRSSGLMSGKNGRCFAFLDDANDNPATLESVRAWLKGVGRYVAIRDCLALSFAIDYDRERGDPARAVTPVGALRARAKPYDGPATPDSRMAADALVVECLAFLEAMTCYASADSVVAMPPSRPNKPFDLPSYIAAGIAAKWGKEDLTAAVATIKERPQLKNVALADKLKTLDGTIQVDASRVKGRTVLLLDDLYQSGVTMNYVGMRLLAGGAKRIFGLASEKTCRNDDNVSGAR